MNLHVVDISEKSGIYKETISFDSTKKKDGAFSILAKSHLY